MLLPEITIQLASAVFTVTAPEHVVTMDDVQINSHHQLVMSQETCDLPVGTVATPDLVEAFEDAWDAFSRNGKTLKEFMICTK